MAKYNMTVTDISGESVSVEAVLNKLGGVAGALRLLRGELAIVEAKAEVLWQTPDQADGRICALQELLDAAPEGDTHTIDWYLEDPKNRIPKEWEGKVVFFRNSEFRVRGDRVVRCLCQGGGRWSQSFSWVCDPVNGHDFLAVPASAL